MLPPKREYEKVPTDNFVNGIIEEIQYEADHEFKGPNAKQGPAIRIVFIIDGMKFPKRTGWMSFSYAEKSTLYQKYLVNLVDNAKPNMHFHIEQLKGLKVKMLWKDDPKNPDFQSLDSIRPSDGKKIIAVENAA